jgi:hypothetical protein
MKTRQLLLLLAIAIVLLAAARWSGSRRRPGPPEDVGKPLLEGLDINAVAAVEIADDARTLRLAREGGTWCVTNAFGYPADYQKLRERLIALRDVRIGQVQHGMRLGTGGVTRVSLLDADGRPLARLLLGERRRGGGGRPAGYGFAEGRYVAREDTGMVCLVKESLDDWRPDPESWMDTQLLSVQADEIAAIEMRDPAGNVVRLDRGSGSLRLEDLDETRETFDTSKSYGLETAFSYLRFTRVADPALSEEQTGISTGHQFKVALKNGETYTARIGISPPDSSDRYFKLAVELAPAETNDAARAAQEKRVAELARKVEPWTFLISSYSAENMTRSRSELVTPKPPATNDVTRVQTAITNDAGQAAEDIAATTATAATAPKAGEEEEEEEEKE